MTIPDVSIVIPAYEAAGRGGFFVERLFASIAEQENARYEIIVADQSNDDTIRRCCQVTDMDVRYLFNRHDRGNSSANMNFGIRFARGSIIKIMHMDDFFCNRDALALIGATVRRAGRPIWGAVGFDHIEELAEGGNSDPTQVVLPSLAHTLGCPSVHFFPNDSPQNLFDEALIIINDHDMTQRLLFRYGSPHIIPSTCVRIQRHAHQVSNMVGPARELEERRYHDLKRRLLYENRKRELS